MKRADQMLDAIGNLLWCCLLFPILAALYVLGGFWRDDKADRDKEND